MKIRRKFKGRQIKKYQNGSTIDPPGTGTVLRPQEPKLGFPWDSSDYLAQYMTPEAGVAVPGAVTPKPTLNDLYNQVGFSDFPKKEVTVEEPAGGRTGVPNNSVETPAKTPDAIDANIQQQAEADKAQESNVASDIDTDPIVTKPDSQIFNPYAGVDIPTAAYLFGENVGKDGDPLTAVASGLKLVTGLGRNITAGIGNTKRNAFQMDELRKKQRESKIGQPTALGKDGGKFGEDIHALFEKVQFPMMDNGGTNPDKKGKVIETERPITAAEAEANSYKNNPDSMFTAEGLKMLGFTNDKSRANIPELDLGKYKDVNYFDVAVTEDGRYTVRNTSKNPANAALYKEQLSYIQKLNPNANIARDSSSGFRPLSTMKDGGEIDEDILTGSVITGTNLGTENVELEDGEFLQEPGGTPKEVEGKKHEQGGEKLDLPGGTEVLSDNLTLNKTQAKLLDEKYGIKVGVKDTYAKALEKYNKQIGLKAVIEEEEELIKEVRKQKEAAAEEGADAPTININLEFLSSKIKDLSDKKVTLEEQSSKVFKEMFELQESTKPKSERAGAQEEFKVGGKVYSRDQIIGISKNFGIDEDKAIAIIKQMAEGGETDPGKRVTKEEAEKNVKKGIWEDLGGGRYIKKGVPGVEGVIYEVDESASAQGELTNKTAPSGIPGGQPTEAWDAKMTEYLNSGISYEELASKGHGTIEGLKKRFPGEYKPEYKESGEADLIVVEQPYKIEGTPDEFFYVDEDGEVKPTKEEDVIKKTNQEKARGKINALLLPENMTLPPQGLQLPTKITRTYGRLDAERLSPDQRLAELNRGVDAAMAQLDKLPSGQKEAAVLQLQANKQAQADKIIQETNAANNQVAQYEDVFNIRQGDRQEDARAIDALDYERRAFGALANTEDDFRRFFNTVQERNIRNFETINSLNLLNQASENFDFGNNGVEFTGGAEMDLVDYLKKTQFDKAVGISNSSKQTSTPKKKRRGGRIKRKY